jgi:molybdopterin molybdotransferase|tara:strand:- start:1098 stop:2306 length:1209 start_codon:yes stop_codon:yes gene_type:complete
METNVTLQRAVDLACHSPFVRRTEKVSLSGAAGRVLAEILTSKVDDPRFDNSAMDGWAVRATDCEIQESILSISGTSKAGGETPPRVAQGEACRIMTGAPVPEGADAIVMVEDSEEVGNTVRILGPARPGYIRKKAENLEVGQEALEKGTHLGPAEISLAATMGHGEIEVVVRPKLAVISTGDELVPPGAELSDGQIHESNSYGIAVLIEKMGGQPIRYDVVHDTIDGLRETLDIAARECDAILTSGGVSMGKWDLVRRLMEEEGDLSFWRVKIRPGGPPLFGTWKKTPLFGLPGNPVSSHVAFISLVAPWLSHCMEAHPENGPTIGDRVKVKLTEGVKGAPGKLCMRRIRIETGEDGLTASVHTHQGSGNIHSMVAHNGLTLLPPDTDAKAGDIIDALWCR